MSSKALLFSLSRQNFLQGTHEHLMLYLESPSTYTSVKIQEVSPAKADSLTPKLPFGAIPQQSYVSAFKKMNKYQMESKPLLPVQGQ